MSKKLMLPLVIFILICMMFLYQLYRNNQGENITDLESAMVGKNIPEFKLASLFNPDETEQIEITNHNMPAQAYLLNVWGSWCPACFDEHPFMLELNKKGVLLIGMNYKDDRLKARQWLANLGNPYKQVIFDPKGSLGFDLGVYGAPETFFINKNGKIIYRHVGVINAENWANKLNKIWQEAQ